jgi:hypothetical protein
VALAPAKTLPGNSNKFRRIVIQVQSGLTAYGYYAGFLTGVVDEDTGLEDTFSRTR